MTASPGREKASLRARVRDARARRTAAQRQDAARAFAVATMALPELVAARCVAAYAARPQEPGTDELLLSLLSSGRTVLLPRVVGEELAWSAVADLATLRAGSFGIREPADDTDVPLTRADVVIAPALAVDAQGTRLGQGGGYFDRALAPIAAPVVVLVHDDEVLDALPREPHDRGVDIVVTPTRVLRCRA